MRNIIAAVLCIGGLVLLLGAAGDSDRGTGTYILGRAVWGIVVLTAGVISSKRKPQCTPREKADNNIPERSE